MPIIISRPQPKIWKVDLLCTDEGHPNVTVGDGCMAYVRYLAGDVMLAYFIGDMVDYEEVLYFYVVCPCCGKDLLLHDNEVDEEVRTKVRRRFAGKISRF